MVRDLASVYHFLSLFAAHLFLIHVFFVCVYSDSEWDCGEEDYLDADDTLCNTMLITGPTGVGKTAAVYACAQELGFKVEINTYEEKRQR